MPKAGSIGFDWVWNVLPAISWYHVLIVTIAGYVGTIGGYTAVYPVFAQKKQDARCPVELDEERYSGFNFTFGEITGLNNVTKEPFDECIYYQLDYSTCKQFSIKHEFISCAAGLNKSEDIIGNCTWEDAIFDTSQFTSTVPSEFHLACGRSTLNSLATSLSFIGLFFGAMLAGYFSDNYGRKLTIVVSIGLNAFFWVLQGWIPTYPMFVILRILVQGANQAAYLTYNCYACEVVGPKGRAYTGMIPNFTFAAGYMSMSLLSFWIPDWRPLTFVLAALSAPFMFTWWFWPESPRWLYSVGRYEEGEKVISTFVKKCNVDLSDFSDPDGPTTSALSNERRFLDTLRKKCAPDEDKDVPEIIKDEKNYSVLTLFTSGRHLAMTTANVAFQFVVVVMAYYGLSYGAGDLPGDIYVNNVINGAVEVAAYVATFFLLNVLGRRLLVGGPLILSGVCMIVGMLIKQFAGSGGAEVFRWMMFAGKFGISGAFGVIWLYSAELFPTDIRTNALAMGSMAGRIGGIISPFINDFYTTIPWLPPTIFGVFCILGGSVLFLLPETLGKPLLNTIEEANAYYGRRASIISSRSKVQSASESARSLNR